MLTILLVLCLLSLALADFQDCAGPSVGKRVRCKSSEVCDQNSDCDINICIQGVGPNGEAQCSNRSALLIILGFLIELSITNSVTLACCIYVMRNKKRQRRANEARAAKKAAAANRMAFHQPEFAHMRTQLLNDLNISLNCVQQWESMPQNQYKEELRSDSELQAVISRFRLLSLGALELMKDEKELEACSEAERDALLDSGHEVHETLTNAAAVLARTLIGGGGAGAVKAVRADLSESSAVLERAHRRWLDQWPESLIKDAELKRDGTVEQRQMAKIERRALGMIPTFHDLPTLGGRASSAPQMFHTIMRYKLFYGCIELLLIVVFLMFIIQLDSNNAQFEGFKDSIGGFGKPYFPFPPQYNFGENKQQSFGVPFVFAFMHMGLVMLGLLIVPMCRGLVRDVVSLWPGIKKWVPIDEFDSVHKQLGTLVLVYLFFGVVIWLFVMGLECLNQVTDSCLAFDAAVNVPFDPIENVVALRLTIWPLWFGIMPWIYFARSGPPGFLVKSKFLRHWWFELCMYSHLLVALATVSLALIARKEVFYPAILSWGAFGFDRTRDYLCFVRRATIRQKTLYADQKQLPVGFRISMELDGSLPIDAGMWVYVCVPSIDPTWHPFSIASSSGEAFVDLHIGIHPRRHGRWVQNNYSEWEHTERQWTYNLYRKLAGSRSSQARDFRIYVRGPYGAAFASCFDSTKGGAVVIGAGTGLTAAESVLREFLHRRAVDRLTPSRLWFVWSCQNVDQLFWCWDQILGLVTAGVNSGVIRPLRQQRGAIIDWLGVTIYLTRDATKSYGDFCKIQREKFTSDNRAVGEWLLTRIVGSSMDSKHTHIESLFRGAHRVLRQTPSAKSRDLAVGFCGPPGLAHIIERAATRSVPADSDISVEFSMDHQ